MKITKNQILAGVCVAVCLGGGWYLLRPKPKKAVMADLPPNSIYYSGPMKGKSGVLAPDSFFPEMGTPLKSNSGTKK